MKTTTIRRTIALIAIVGTIPLAVFGFRSFSATMAPHEVGMNPIAPSLATDGKRFTIHVPAGRGETVQSAIRNLPFGGGRILLAEGTYLFHDPLVIDRDDVELSGYEEKTILKLADRANCPLLVIGPMETPPTRKVSDVVVRKLLLDGNRISQDHECYSGVCDNGGLSFIRNNAITIRAAANVRIEHVTTRRARSGGMVLEKTCRNIRVSDFVSYDNQFDGLAAYETEESVFTRMYLHGNVAAGISADIRFNRNIISHSRLENNGSQGIFMRDSNFNNFTKLTIDHNGAQGIFIAQADDQQSTPCTGNVFSDLVVSNNKGVGFRVNDISCIANTLANSKFKSNGEGAVSEVFEKLVTQVSVELQ